MTALHFLILACAAARFTRMVILDSGPLAIFSAFRNWIGAEDQYVRPGSVAELFNCPWCFSLWIAIPMFFFYAHAPWVTVCVAAPFAISFVAGSLVILTTRT